jgi:zinc protease
MIRFTLRAAVIRFTLRAAVIRFSLRAAVAAALLLPLTLPADAQVEVTEITTPGGIDAWLVEEPSLPFVALELLFAGGSALDPVGEEGAAALMAAMLDLGAGDLDEQAFAEALEAVAAEISVEAGGDSISISARFLTEFRDESVALLRKALTEPRFDDDAFARTQARALSGARSALRNPNRLASLEMNRLAWGEHPYGRPDDGTEESLGALTPEHLRAAHARGLARDRVHVAAVGDIDAATLAGLLDDLLGGLPATGAPLPPRAEPALTGGVTVVPFDGPQSLIAFAQRGIDRDDPDFFAAFVMSEVLGGGRFGTRLMRALREERGLTYGVGIGLASRPYGDSIQGRFSTSNDRAAEAIALVRAEWARMAEEGLSAEELEAIQTYLTGAYPLRFDGNGRIAAILASMQFQGLPAGYMAERNDLVRAVTPDQVEAIAARLLDPEGLHFVVVGRPEGLETGPVPGH